MRIKRPTPLSNYLDRQSEAPEVKGDLDYFAPVAKLATECVSLRDEQALSQTELARRMGTKQSVISRFENLDGRLPSYDFIARLSIALGNTPGMTLQGGFMAIVPPDRQSYIVDLARREGVSTRSLVGSLLEGAIATNQARESHVIVFANATEVGIADPSLGAVGSTREARHDREVVIPFANAG